MATVSLSATNRTPNGKGGARKIRGAGNLVGVVYGPGQQTTPITMDPHELEKAFRKTMDPNTLIKLDVEGTEHLCLVQDVQRHPVTHMMRHVDLYEVAADQEIEVQVRLRAIGTAVGAEVGGSLQYIHRTLDVRCKVTAIPADIEVDISHLDVDEFIKVSEVNVPEGGRILYEDDFNVICLRGKRGLSLEEEEALEAEALAAAEAAEGAEGAEGEGAEDSDED